MQGETKDGGGHGDGQLDSKLNNKLEKIEDNETRGRISILQHYAKEDRFIEPRNPPTITDRLQQRETTQYDAPTSPKPDDARFTHSVP